MFKITLPKDIFSRKYYEITSFVFGLSFYILFISAVKLKFVLLPDNPVAKILLLLSVPIDFTFLYFTSYRKIFPQRIGDSIQAILGIMLLAVANALFSGKIGINGPFFIGFIFLIPLYLFLLDYFLPIFMGAFLSFLLIIEFLIVGINNISFLTILDLLFKISTLIIFAIVNSYLINKILSERKTREKLELAYEDLKRLDKAKSEFVSIASHQLRTPLSAIKGYVSMVLEGSYGKVPEKAIRPLENVSQSNERLIKLVNDLLNVSKIEAGRLEMNYEKADIEEIVKSVFDEMKNEAEKKNLYLKLEAPEERLPKVSVDKDKFRQVILNLVDNAIRYTEKGGITIGLQVIGSRLQVIISDTGEGMNEEEIEKVFTSFSRGSAGTKLYTEGAGLGLYVARKFVDIHNGKIWVESKGKGKGTNFFIELPIK